MVSFPFDAHYYRSAYRDYARQNPPRKLRFYARMVERHLAPGLPRRIHDLGCGFGDFLAALDESWEVCGSDVSEFAIAQAAARHPRGAFKAASATDPAPFAGTFGVVTAFDLLEHVPDLDAAAAAVTAQLAPGGSFIFVVPVYDGLSGPLIRALDRDSTHLHKWPRRSWLDWASTHFEVLDWVGMVRYLFPALGYLHIVTRLFRRHTPAILVACRRA
ncbi:MAG: class I SAM-dependent methyltransferase [Planctomycetes bacterium]|nr:class I SAM-dependent methyltransferase [Planctomycetota bacterium]